MPRFPPRGPHRRLFPRFNGTIKALRLPASIPPRFVSFTWRYHGSTHVSLPPPLRGAASGLGLVTRYPLPGILRGNDRSSQVPGEPQFPFAHGLRPRPADASLTDCGTPAWPPLRERRRHRREDFRGSIAWLSGSPPTYRATVIRLTAQGWLPGAGQALPDGLSPAEFLQKVLTHFMCVNLLFQASWHNPFFMSGVDGQASMTQGPFAAMVQRYDDACGWPPACEYGAVTGKPQ